MATPTVYRWDDANAPVVTNIHDWTQIKAWFQAIFVNGYLEDDNTTMKNGLGWSVGVDDATKKITLDMIGDANTENLMRVRADFSKQVNNNYFGSSIIAFSHQELYKLSSASDNPTYSFFPWIGQNDDDLKICPWIIIGNARGVYVLSGFNDLTTAPIKSEFSTKDKYASAKYFGNFVNDGIDYGRNNQCISFGREPLALSSPTSLSTQNSYVFSKNYPILINRTFKNEYVLNRIINCEEMMDGNYVYLSAPAFGLRYPYIDGGMYIKPYKMYSTVDKVYVGKFPSLYYSKHKRPLSKSGNSLIEFDGTGTYAGDKFIGLGFTVNSEFYINTTEDWGI